MVLIPNLFHLLFLFLLSGLGEFPDPLPRSEKPRKETKETTIYTLVVIIYLTLDIFFFRRFIHFLYIVLGFSSIIFLLIPFFYTRYRDHWTSKDLGVISKIKAPSIVIASVIFYTYFGYANTLTAIIPWYLLLIYFYSNAFFEEFLFRGVIQSKLERAIGQKRALIFQAFAFMAFHVPVNIFNYFLDGNLLRLFSAFGLQLINGAIYGLIFMKTRNLWISVICHYLNNWLGAIITLFL